MTKKTSQEYREELSAKSLASLRMKNAYFTKKRKAELIGNLTLDDKLLLGAILNDTDHQIRVMEESGIEELDGELSFGNKTFEDGVEVFTNNKY
jgi:hypothetical protein